mgnify:FL=1
MNPNTPVIIGVAQILKRGYDKTNFKEPIDLMVEASKKAAKDAGNPTLVENLDSVRVVRGWWRYENPAGYVSAALGCKDAETVGTAYGGNMVQNLLNASAKDVLEGKNDLLILTGAEVGNAQAKARKLGESLPQKETEGAYDRVIGDDKSMSSEAEIARGILRPIQIYPMFENALRAHLGETITDHNERVSELWAMFSAEAEKNPDAWISEAKTAREISSPGPRNRMISFPYPKLMNSNNAVDMSAAIILCSVEKAKSLGIDKSKWIYPWVGTEANDTYFVSERENLYSSPAIRIAGRRAMELAGLSPDKIDLVDLYSCFPSAVQIAARELGFSLDRPLTVTGGLTFGGGPLNNYVMHSISRMVALLRESPEKKGMITANGGFLTKHSFGIYSATSPVRDFQYENLQAEVNEMPTRESVADYEGPATLESYTVMFSNENPEIGHCACLTPEGKRTWANVTDNDVLELMQVEEFCGRRVLVDGKGNLGF